MWNLLWPMLMVVGANTVYNICAKSVPDKLNSFAALTINYLVAAGLSLALFLPHQRGREVPGAGDGQDQLGPCGHGPHRGGGWNWGTSSSTGRGGR